MAHRHDFVRLELRDENGRLFHVGYSCRICDEPGYVVPEPYLRLVK